MRVAGSLPGARAQGFSRSVHARGMQRRYRRRYGLESEAVLILVLFMLLIVVLLFFS
ncbi:hypothetical protein D3C81_2250290 [compost metagenome]